MPTTQSPTSTSDVTLITGFPAFTARRMAKKVLEADPAGRVYLLVRSKFRLAAEEFVTTLDATPGLGARTRLTILDGDVLDMDLGLAGAEYKALAAEVTSIHHLAGIYFPGVKREVAERVNVEGTRAVLELGGECERLRRLSYFSTTNVSGTRSGVVLEDELDEGQRFHNVYEETKFRAECLVKEAASHLPVTIFRPGVIVGDSATGEIDRFDGPYYLTVLIVASPVDVHLPLPGKGAAPLYLTPIDFVIDAAYALSLDATAVNKTFHLTDPSPFAARYVYELIAKSSGKKPPRGIIPTSLAKAILKAPGLGNLARAPLAFLESFNQMVIYNCKNTMAHLEATPIRCPSFDSYVDNLVRYVKDVHTARRKKLEDEVFDPFD